jgi:hypothetical protein
VFNCEFICDTPSQVDLDIGLPDFLYKLVTC